MQLLSSSLAITFHILWAQINDVRFYSDVKWRQLSENKIKLMNFTLVTSWCNIGGQFKLTYAGIPGTLAFCLLLPCSISRKNKLRLSYADGNMQRFTTFNLCLVLRKYLVASSNCFEIEISNLTCFLSKSIFKNEKKCFISLFLCCQVWGYWALGGISILISWTSVDLLRLVYKLFVVFIMLSMNLFLKKDENCPKSPIE